MATPETSNAELFRLLVASVEDYAIFVLDPEGRVSTWNPGAERIKGYTTEEILGQHFSLFYPPEDRARGVPARVLGEAASTGHWQGEGWRIRKDGTRFWANVTITALRDADGELVGFAKVTRDLTERRRSEEELRHREQRLAQAQQIGHVGSWEWEVDADRLTWSDELHRIFGLEAGEIPAGFDGYLRRVHADDRETVERALQNALRTTSAFEFDERIVRPDGEVRVLRSRGEVRRDATGSPRMLGVSLDITPLREAERQAIELARESAARSEAEAAAHRMSFLAEASRILGASLDYETTLRNVAMLAVPDFADWCAVDLFDEAGIHRVALHHRDPDRIHSAEKLSSRYPPNPDATTGVGRVRRTGDTIFVPEITDEILIDAARSPEHLKTLREMHLTSAIVAPLRGRDRVLGALTLVQAESGRRYDVNDRLFAEDLARRAGMAVDTAQLVQELRVTRLKLEEQATELESQTRELKNALRNIENTTDQLRASNDALRTKSQEAERARAAAEEANETKSRFLATMSHELRTPLNAISGYAQLVELGVHGPVTEDQLQAIRRIQRNQRHLLGLINDLLHLSKIEAGQLRLRIEDISVAELFDDLEPLIQPLVTDRKLDFRSDARSKQLCVRADRDRLDQILVNLLSNAVKFSRPGDRIEVRAEPAGDRVLLHVQDTAGGIPPERLQSIFEPFVQIHTGRDAEGLGLGLAISRDLARAMGGDLTATSEVDRGSTFTVSLPRGRGQALNEGAE